MIYVHLAEGFEEVEALTIVDLLRRAGATVETVSIYEETKVTGTHGIDVIADITFDEADYDKCDMIVLPGGLPGADNLGNHKGLTDQIKKLQQQERKLQRYVQHRWFSAHAGFLKAGKQRSILAWKTDLQAQSLRVKAQWLTAT